MHIQIKGKVIYGDGYGKQLGFPTANIDRKHMVREKLSLREGIYAGLVIREKTRKEYLAGIVIGPTDTKRLPKLEAHLINFKGTLYGEKLTFILKKYLHPFKKYKNEEELKKAIKKDIEKIISL